MFTSIYLSTYIHIYIYTERCEQIIRYIHLCTYLSVLSLLEISRMRLHPFIIEDVKSLLETRIGLDPLMSAKCGCQVYLQHP